MEKKILVLDNSSQMVEMMKMITSNQMVKVEELLLNEELPKREDYETEEEYQTDYRMFMLDAIDIIKDVKKQLFTNVLDSYNEFLFEKYHAEEEIKKTNKECEEIAFNAGRDIRNTGIATVVLTLLLPSLFPIIVVVSLGRVGFRIIQVKSCIRASAYSNMLEEELKNIQLPFYEFTDTLRTDYHKSNRELKELEEKAINGENIMGELLEMIKPERLSLKRVESLPFDEEEEKQYIKERK